jgi:hypothetical protein
MTDKKISELTALTGANLADGDLFTVVDVSDTTTDPAGAAGSNKKITRQELVAGLAGRSSWDGTGTYSMAATDRYVGQTGTLSAGRTFRLVRANAVPAGAQVTVADESGTCSQSLQLAIRCSAAVGAADTIDGYFDSTSNGGTTDTSQFPRLKAPYSSVTLVSDGSSKWTVVSIKPAIDIQVFTANGTWLRPLGFSNARIILFGGGGGGGSGRRSAAGGNAYGGGGGQAGGVTVVDVPLADLPNASYTVTVGAAVNAVAGRTTNLDGLTGTNGNPTWFSAADKWTARGGEAGSGGLSTGGGNPGSARGNGMTVGAAGGTGDGSYGVQGGGSGGTYVGASVVAPGGGGGGGYHLAGTAFAGGTGGNSSGGVGTDSAGVAGGTAGANTGAAGGSGTAITTISTNMIGGSAGGGGGGGAASGTAGGAGGAGAAPGGGGGGGAGGVNANSGAGGGGARGAAIIICW